MLKWAYPPLTYDKNNFSQKLQFCQGGTILKAYSLYNMYGDMKVCDLPLILW